MKASFSVCVMVALGLGSGACGDDAGAGGVADGEVDVLVPEAIGGETGPSEILPPDGGGPDGADDTAVIDDTGDTGSADTGDTVSADTGDTGDTGSGDTADTGSGDTGDTGSADSGDTADTGSADSGDTGSADSGDTADTSAPDTTPSAPDLRHPDPTLPTYSAATLAQIDIAMRDALDAPGLTGRTFGGLVVDVDTGQEVWALDADRLLIPASNTKVFTTAAAFELLGAEHRMLTRVYGPAIDGAGAVTGLELHGEHDFTWSHWFYGDPREPADRLADALYRKGLRRVAGSVGVWGAYLYEGHHFGTYDPATHRTRAGNAFIAALEARGIAVDGGLVDHATMETPPGVELAAWHSIPLYVGAWAINRRSHNEMADILARHIGWLEGGSSDYVTGGREIHDWLAGTGVVDADDFYIGDGSGLDVANEVSARHLVGAYRAMLASPNFELWRQSLTIGGAGGPASVDANDVAIVTENTSPFMGTLASRMTGADTAGRVFGKSGTNAGITTSGILYHRHDGHRYAFAFEMNELPDYDLARVVQDALVAVVARDWRQVGARPAVPTLGCARVRGDGLVEVDVTAAAAIDAADGKAGLALETSRDGVVWSRASALFVKASPFVLAPPADGGVLYVRARAESSAGLSDPSDVYPVRAAGGAGAGGGARVLLVDADDRWQRQPTNENPMGAAHTFMVAYGAAMPDGVAFDTCPNEAVTDGRAALAAYDVVVWSAGEEATTDESFAAAEATALGDYLAAGGALFASGAEIAWDLDARGNGVATASDTAFLRDALASTYVGDDAGVYVAEGTPGGIFADLTHDARLGFWTPGQIFVAYPDELAPVGAASACLSYLGPGTTACVQSANDPAVVLFGFPFESIDASAERALVMGRVLTFLGAR